MSNSMTTDNHTAMAEPSPLRAPLKLPAVHRTTEEVARMLDKIMRRDVRIETRLVRLLQHLGLDTEGNVIKEGGAP